MEDFNVFEWEIPELANGGFDCWRKEFFFVKRGNFQAIFD